jgi:hypothetical protein
MRRSCAPAVQDAAEFAGLACKRWRFYQRVGRGVRSFDELRAQVAQEPGAEVALLLVVRAAWHRADPQLGVCLVRRTWSNNLCLDFLAVNPANLVRRQRRVDGVGSGLVYCVTEVAEAVGARFIRGEATELSAPMYQHIFGLRAVDDFFRLSRRVYRRFRTRMEARWASRGLPFSP